MKDLDTLFSDDFALRVEENLGRDPSAVALDKRLADAAPVASQVKYLQRAERKLPSYHAARCVIPPLAFEQSSGEDAAARREYSGELCIDLTCGLGVDSFHFSKRFAKVIAVERDPRLAAIARENFRRLGADNIRVVEASAEGFIAGFATKADLIYADPDRRSGAGRKLVRMEDCSPDIVALLPLLRAAAERIVVKLSPIFDVAEVFRVFGEHSRASVISVGGECKEVLAETSEDIPAPVVRAVAVGTGEAEFGFTGGEAASAGGEFRQDGYRWLVVPDVALQKSRTAMRYFSDRIDYIDSDNGYGFSVSRPGAVMGKVLRISAVEPFDPKALKRRLRSEGIRKIDILKRNFPLSATELACRLGVGEGGTKAVAFTKADGRLWQITLDK